MLTDPATSPEVLPSVLVVTRTDEIGILLDQGLSQKEIAAKIGLSESSISYHVAKLSRGYKQPRYNWLEVRAFYDSGNTYKQCAEKFGVSKNCWTAAIGRGLIVPRPRTHKTRTELYRRNQCLAVTEIRRKLKLKAIEYKGGKCVSCGYAGCPAAFDFHHTDPASKDFSISGSHKAFSNIKSELDKTVLLCANCHRELHDKLASEKIAAKRAALQNFAPQVGE